MSICHSQSCKLSPTNTQSGFVRLTARNGTCNSTPRYSSVHWLSRTCRRSCMSLNLGIASCFGDVSNREPLSSVWSSLLEEVAMALSQASSNTVPCWTSGLSRCYQMGEVWWRRWAVIASGCWRRDPWTVTRSDESKGELFSKQ